MNIPVSVIILAKNERDLISRAVESVQWAAEIVVVDSGSSDGTQDRASRAGARVIDQAWLGWSEQRNFGASQAANDWIFVLEADELPDQSLSRAIKALNWETIPADRAFAVDRRGDFLGILLPNSQRSSQIHKFVRLYNRQSYAYDTNQIVHEQVHVVPELIDLLPGRLLHWRGASIDEYPGFAVRNAKVEAVAILRTGRPSSLKLLLVPFARLFYLLFVKREALLGWRGVLHAFHRAYEDSLRLAFIQEATRENGSTLEAERKR